MLRHRKKKPLHLQPPFVQPKRPSLMQRVLGVLERGRGR
jgi:hypothetical protein